MKTKILNSIKIKSKILMCSALLMLMGNTFVYSQENGKTNYAQLEEYQDIKMDYIKKLNKITNKYPLFSYQYTFDNGKVKDVTVTGVDNEVDVKQIKVILLDLQSNKNKLQNKANRIGVFYDVDKRAEYKKGEDALYNDLLKSLAYPEGAKDWGVEGTVYVRFVVDENGNIPYASMVNDIKTTMKFYEEDLTKQAVSAIKNTSGDWEPGTVKGVKVPSFIVIPITFDFKKNPSIPALIR